MKFRVDIEKMVSGSVIRQSASCEKKQERYILQ